MQNKKNFHSKRQIGIWKKEQTYECVWFDEQNKPHFCLIQEPISLADCVTLLSNKTTASHLKTMCFITAIAPQYTWTKTLLLPQRLNTYECEQQCRFLLSQELPLPLEEIWFDYHTEQIKQGLRLDIFAIKKQMAKDYVRTYSPFPIKVLDCCINAIIRAFHYLIINPIEGGALFIYQDEQYTFAINNAQQIQFIQQIAINLTALVEQFCQRYTFKPERIYCYCSPNLSQQLPKHWQLVETEFPLIALGNALWQQSFLPQKAKNEY